MSEYSIIIVWFYTIIYNFGKREGHENQREMKPGDRKLKATTSGMKYFVFSESATKNHPGLISDNEDYIESICNDGIARKSAWFGGLS